MDFGKIPLSELINVDFSLPPDPAETTAVLRHSASKAETRFNIGCAKWARKDWVGKLYPPGAKDQEFLPLYAALFNSIEFNALGYKLPSKAQVQIWKDKVGAEFLFCPKFTNLITHIKRLKNTHDDVGKYLDVMSEFGDNLGPVFLLPSPQMSPKDRSTIEAFIDDLPKDIPLFLELRHPEWYLENGYDPLIYAFLRDRQRGAVITDTAGRRDCVHMHLSTPECFIRFVGNSLDKSDYFRIDAWVARLKKWKQEGLEKCYFFMHQHDELYSPELIKYLIEQLNIHCGAGLKVPETRLKA